MLRRPVFQAIIFSILIHVGIIGFEMVRGFIQTLNYRPALSTAYEDVNILQNEVAFGVINHSSSWTFVLSFFGWAIVFIVIKALLRKVKTAREKT